jgi:hypothetical protein
LRFESSKGLEHQGLEEADIKNNLNDDAGVVHWNYDQSDTEYIWRLKISCDAENEIEE